jgi:hypothetical protein
LPTWEEEYETVDEVCGPSVIVVSDFPVGPEVDGDDGVEDAASTLADADAAFVVPRVETVVTENIVVATADDDVVFTPTDDDTIVVSATLAVSELLSRFIETVSDNGAKLVVDGASLFADDEAALEPPREETADFVVENKLLFVGRYVEAATVDDLVVDVAVTDVTGTEDDADDNDVDRRDAEVAVDGTDVAVDAEIWLL